jgi:hypothetical protein
MTQNMNLLALLTPWVGSEVQEGQVGQGPSGSENEPLGGRGRGRAPRDKGRSPRLIPCVRRALCWIPSPVFFPYETIFRGLFGEIGRTPFPFIPAFTLHFQLLSAMIARPYLKARKTPWQLETSMRTGLWLGGDDDNTDEA